MTSISPKPNAMRLAKPEPALAWLAELSANAPVSLDNVAPCHVFTLAAIAALCRHERPQKPKYLHEPASNASHFARAVGIEDVIAGREAKASREKNRTVTMRRIRKLHDIETVSKQIASLVVSRQEDEHSRDVIQFILVELMRNVIQHSQDPLGGVVVAQKMKPPFDGYKTPTIQIAVADNGVGILEALRGEHTDLSDPADAITRALRPHLSGTFPEGMTGSKGPYGGSQNAGLGLFMINQFARLVRGRMLIASPGAYLLNEGFWDNKDDPHLRQHLGKVGYAGTLVAFEFPQEEIRDYAGLMETVSKRANEMRPSSRLERWLSYDPAPRGTLQILINTASENTVEAERYSQAELVPRLMKKQAITLDFRNFDICTQSFMHALLYEPLRVAWAMRTQIYVTGTNAAVRSALDMLESYALFG